MITTKEQLNERYLHDKRYDLDPDNFDQTMNNRYSLRNYYGLYFDMKRTIEFMKVLNNNKIRLKDKKVLDIGCNYGWFTNLFAYLKKDGKSVYGIDFISKYIKKAREINSSINFMEANVYKLPFEDNTFDLVLCNYVFNSILAKDLKDVAGIISSKTKSKGYILFLDFYRSIIHSAILQKLNKKEACFTHFNDKKIKEMFPDFKIIKSKTMINTNLMKTLMKAKLYPPYWLIEIVELILPKHYCMVLLQKR